jgi:hypothetical protein
MGLVASRQHTNFVGLVWDLKTLLLMVERRRSFISLLALAP